LRVIKAPIARKTKARLEVKPAAEFPPGAEVGDVLGVVVVPVLEGVREAVREEVVTVELETPVAEAVEADLVVLPDLVELDSAPPITSN